MKYTAVIVEPRKHKGLHHVLENFMNNLSEEWSFVIFHGLINLDFIKKIIKEHLIKHSHRIKLVELNFHNLTVNNYNNLLKYSNKFYSYIPTETFLIFQTDSIIIQKHKNLINDFLEYDYVGAPWNHSPFNLNGSPTIGVAQLDAMITCSKCSLDSKCETRLDLQAEREEYTTVNCFLVFTLCLPCTILA